MILVYEMATKEQCKKCVHRKKKDCPILKALHEKGVKGENILQAKCISHRDKR